LIELENYINKLISDKSNLNQKYSKFINIESKLSQNESVSNSILGNEDIKKLNEKINELSNENKNLKNQMADIMNKNDIMKNSDYSNIFNNNYVKEKVKERDIYENVKILEQRVLELERNTSKNTRTPSNISSRMTIRDKSAKPIPKQVNIL
jgi:hypothetical protein